MNFWLILTVMFCLTLTACKVHEAPASLASTENNLVTLKSIPANLTEEPAKVVEAVTSSIGVIGEVREAQFIDADHGWVISSRTLYRTSNAGTSWEGSNLRLPDDSYISSLSFVDANHGWITVIQKGNAGEYTRDYSSSIMSTNDGGTTWTTQSLFADEVKLNHVSFLDVNKGIAVGGKAVKENQAHVIFAVRTSDGGKTWNEIGERLKAAIDTPYLAGNDLGDKVYWMSSSHIFLLTARNRVLVSETGGEVWKTLVVFEEERLFGKSGFYKLLITPKWRFGLLGGSAGDEGYWGTVVTSDDQNQWQSYELIRVPVRDGMFLSETQLLACGLEVKAGDKQQPSVGIVLYSTDRGKNWSPVYRTHSNAALISLTRINDTDFYAVSENGDLIKFKMK